MKEKNKIIKVSLVTLAFCVILFALGPSSDNTVNFLN